MTVSAAAWAARRAASRRRSRSTNRATNTPESSVAATSTAPATSDTRRRSACSVWSLLNAWTWYTHRTTAGSAGPNGWYSSVRTPAAVRGRGRGDSHVDRVVRRHADGKIV